MRQITFKWFFMPISEIEVSGTKPCIFQISLQPQYIESDSVPKLRTIVCIPTDILI
jgi:hypothetical protein